MITRWRAPRDDERQLAWVAFAVAAAGIALSPLASLFARLAPPCLLREWAGIPCPTCGSTRAALALIRLDIVGAAAVNPLASVAIASLVAVGLAAPWWIRFGGKLPVLSAAARRTLLWGALAAVAGNWIYLVISRV